MPEGRMRDAAKVQQNRVLLLDGEVCRPLLSSLHALLCDEEQLRATAFPLPAAREQFIVGRGVLRLLLGAALQCAPAAVPICYGAAGKPGLCGQPGVEFNVSHSNGVFAFALGRGGPLGIDVELVDPAADVVELASTAWGTGAAAEVARCPPGPGRQVAFFARWVRHEAESKRDGCGVFQPRPGAASVASTGFSAAVLSFACFNRGRNFVCCLAYTPGEQVEPERWLCATDVRALL